METPQGDRIAGRSIPYNEQVMKYLGDSAELAKIIKSLGGSQNDITNALNLTMGLGTRRSLPDFWNRVPNLGNAIYRQENLYKAELFRQAARRPRGETTNRPQPFTPPQYPRGYNIGPAVPNWGTPPVLNTDNSNYRIPVRF